MVKFGDTMKHLWLQLEAIDKAAKEIEDSANPNELAAIRKLKK